MDLALHEAECELAACLHTAAAIHLSAARMWITTGNVSRSAVSLRAGAAAAAAVCHAHPGYASAWKLCADVHFFTVLAPTLHAAPSAAASAAPDGRAAGDQASAAAPMRSHSSGATHHWLQLVARAEPVYEHALRVEPSSASAACDVGVALIGQASRCCPGQDLPFPQPTPPPSELPLLSPRC
jgi:hypothetical protein